MNRMREIEAMCQMMNDTGQDYLWRMAKQLVRSFPRTGSLPLVKQADDIKLLDHSSNCAIYEFPLGGVSQTVDRKEA